MELLNLDDLTTIERVVTIRGQRYSVADRSVGQMIESLAMVKRGTKATEEQFLDSMVKTVKAILPDCPEEVVRSMSLRQMTALMEFVNQDPNKIAAEAVSEARESGQAGNVESEKELAKPGEK